MKSQQKVGELCFVCGRHEFDKGRLISKISVEFRTIHVLLKAVGKKIYGQHCEITGISQVNGLSVLCFKVKYFLKFTACS